MNLKSITVLIALIFTGAIVAAQERQKLTLQQAIDLSLKSSAALRVSDVRIIEAEAELRAAKDRALPDASVSGSYLRLGGADVNLKGGQGGGNTPKVNQALYGIANVSYPLYAGGRIKYGIESAKYLAQAARLNAENDKEAIIYNTILAYTNLYKASLAVNVIEENLNASATRDTTFSRLEANGLLARNDLLKSQLQTSNIELTLLDARNNFNIATVNMALMLGLPENTLLEVDNNFVNDPKAMKPFVELENLALQTRKDVQAINVQKKAAALGSKSAKAEAYPSLALTGGYVAADIPKLITITNALNIGIGVRYNISSLWKTNTGLQQAKARETELAASESMLTDRIRLEINRDYQNWLLAQKKIDVYDKAIVQATENYRITKNKYDNNLVTITDLLDADVSLLQTKLNAAAARADAALAYNKVLATTGTL